MAEAAEEQEIRLENVLGEGDGRFVGLETRYSMDSSVETVWIEAIWDFLPKQY